RSAEFTQKYGLTPTIMDYARINYVAQPEDEGVRYIRMMGPYDLYAINWGYRYYPALDPTEEKEILDSLILAKAGDPIYEFGDGYDGVDPQSQRESLGDDQVKASEYGLANLKKVVPNLVEWTSRDGHGYEDLDEVYRELTNIWRGYINHVVANVGGVYETRKISNQEGVVYEPVPRKMQQTAVNFLLKNAFSTPHWLLDQNLLHRIEPTGAIERIQNLQTSALRYLLDEDRLKRMVGNEQVNGEKAYSVIELMEDLRKGIFSELYSGEKTDVYRRNLQRSFVDTATNYVSAIEEERSNDDLLKSDIIALMRGELEKLKRGIMQQKNSSSDQLTQFHWNDLIARIDAGLETED
ncbi:MAG TPA: zinc-dependent metalloprotease, partial [Salinimicrobium sp.]|nr:zinc-dependent metalloprotease [Salinimicrobium sp.]